ncbi:recombinase [Amycolatopsis methanolica 239]|uniref:Recombinase n=1 Tax=Amycolatopsis methanolica 239 TaxID=1068978 RepID=A0A076MZ24_AMYME|nr:recombinase [Amycolatopsis methanolica 239]AIJ26454.1 recombinase [Amycolatopsis methanolica 239]
MRRAKIRQWRTDHRGPYRDVGGASRHSRGSRGDFARLMQDLESGDFERGEILQLWEASRGSRRESEWLRLIELCEEHQVYIWVEVMGRLFNCADWRDRRALLDEALDASAEASKTSERTRDQLAVNAAEGLPHGIPGFGFIRKYDPKTGELIGQFPDPEAAPWVEEAFRRVAAGHSQRAIAEDFYQRGLRTRKGTKVTQQHMRSWLVNPAYAGLRVHSPGVRGNRSLKNAKALVTAQWEAIVQPDLFYAVQERLQANACTNTRPGAAVHLLSLIARCGVCGSPVAYIGGSRDAYRCNGNTHVSIRKGPLEELATDIALRFLADPRQYGALDQADDERDAEIERIRTQLAGVRAELAELKAKVRAGTLSVGFASDVAPGLEQRIAKLEREREQLARPSVLRGLIEPGPDVAERWQHTPIAARRAIMRLLFAKNVLGELHVMPAGRRQPFVPAEERVALVRDEPTEHGGLAG